MESGSDLEEVDIQVNMLLSQEVVALGYTSRTLTFFGSIQGHEVVILVDLGNSNSFINAKLAPALVGISQLSTQ
jgi:hypothetical protein